MVDDALLSDLEWTAKLAGASANVPRFVEACELIAMQYPMYAKQYRRFFLALTAEGFTPEQALELIKAHGWLPR